MSKVNSANMKRPFVRLSIKRRIYEQTPFHSTRLNALRDNFSNWAKGKNISARARSTCPDDDTSISDGIPWTHPDADAVLETGGVKALLSDDITTPWRESQVEASSAEGRSGRPVSATSR